MMLDAYGQPGLMSLPFAPQGPFGGQLSPFGGQLSPFGGQPFGGQLSPFGGQPFGGQLSPFGGQPFGGQLSPFGGQPFGGQLSPFGGQPFGGQLSPFGGQPFGPQSLFGHVSQGQLSPALAPHGPFGGGIAWPTYGPHPFGLPTGPIIGGQFGIGQFGASQIGTGVGPFGRGLPIEIALATLAASGLAPQLAAWLHQAHLAGIANRSISPYQTPVPQMAYAGA